jgi:signal transduction histidine kinase
MKRLTLRARLTLVYGGLFLLAGVVLLAVTYVLVDQRMPQPFKVAAVNPETVATKLPKAAIAGQDPENLRMLLQQVQTDARQSALDSLLTQGGIALALVSAVAIAFGWLIAGRALQPLHQITGTARRIAGADTAGRGLHERIALGGPRDEVRELANTFDEMLERLDRSFDGQRRFVANASHELRTPLALNRSLVELAITRPGASADLKQLGESLLAVNERHERLIDGLLTLADSENEVTERVPVDLADVAAHLVDQTAAKTDLEIERELRPAPTAGDPVLLERLTHNLLENAIRHNVPEQGWVSVRTAVDGGSAVLVVANTGPVVPAYEMETIFQPFRRLRHERIGGGRGFGLGLSIVRAVARAHGGSVAARPRPEGGLVVTVTLPRQ